MSNSTNLSNLRPLIDCDLLCYRIGFAVKDDEPVENALHNVKATLASILERFPKRGHEASLYLTGKDNFRHAVATIKKYKGNRDNQPRPKYYKEIREYLMNYHRAQLIEGREADDALGCEQWSCKDRDTCIVSTDKDMYMIPGWNYNWVKDEVRYITKDEADRFLFWQMLVGDSTDNIPGVDGIGKVKATRLVDGCSTIPELAEKVKALYRQQYGEDWYERYIEVATLLCIQREEGKLYPFVL